MYISTDESILCEEVKQLILSLWQPRLVGIGRDAKGLKHTSIEIVNIRLLSQSRSIEKYNKRKKALRTDVTRRKNRLHRPGEFQSSVKPVATEAMVNNLPNLKSMLDPNINEFYLFHGTEASNVESIEKENFRSGKGMFRRAVYFADRPVKSDQYSYKGI